MDGVLNSDHSPRSALIEYKKAVEPVQVLSFSTKAVTIINRLDFVTLDEFRCFWSLTSDGESSAAHGEIELPSGIEPGDTAELTIPVQFSDSRETLLNLQFTLKQAKPWAQEGHEVALLQIPLAPPQPLDLGNTSLESPLRVVESSTALTIKGNQVEWQLDLVRGRLTSWLKAEQQLLAAPVEPSFYRAVTDNDAPRDGRNWKDRLLHMASVHTRSSKWVQSDKGAVVVEFAQKFAPPVLSWSVDITTEYTFSNTGTVEINVKGTPQGQNLPATLARLGVTLGLQADLDNVKWFGRGPGESYKDMKLGQRVDLHSSTVEKLWVDPEFPQESSNRTDTRWLSLSSANCAITAQFKKAKDSSERHLFDFMASWYDVKDIDEAQHPYELKAKKRDYVVLRLDADHHGLGKCHLHTNFSNTDRVSQAPDRVVPRLSRSMHSRLNLSSSR